jgi:hypothetical protein
LIIPKEESLDEQPAVLHEDGTKLPFLIKLEIIYMNLFFFQNLKNFMNLVIQRMIQKTTRKRTHQMMLHCLRMSFRQMLKKLKRGEGGRGGVPRPKLYITQP